MTTRSTTLLVAILILIGMGLPRAALAARVIFSPDSAHITAGDAISVDVILDTEGASVNALTLKILYPKVVGVSSVSKSNSVITLWLQEPSFTSRDVTFTGGVPRGITTNHGLVGHMTIQGRAVGTGSIALDPLSQVLLNDGQGTAVTITSVPMVLEVSARSGDQAPLTVSPSPATESTMGLGRPELHISSDPSVFGGSWFASFYTNGEAGVDHYELSEGKGPYRIARTPFLLSDQRLHSVIHLRAYDAAGHWRQAIWPGLLKRIWWWIIGLFGFH